jgi:tetratricopeptide (TPR) repeat protein
LAGLGLYKEADERLQLLYRTSEKAAFRASFELAILYGHQAKVAPAIHYSRQFLDIIARQNPPRCRNECMEIGNLALRLGDSRSAAEAFEQALRAKPSDVAVHKLLAICYKNLGRSELSREQLILAGQFGGSAP